MGSSGAVRGTSSVTLNTAPAAAAAIPAAISEGTTGAQNAATFRRSRKNLISNNRWRTIARMSVAASAGAKTAFQWSLNQSDWFWADGVASASAPGADAYVSMAAAVALSSNWIAIPAAARADVWFRAVTFDGDGVTTGAVAQLMVEVE